jgi:chromosome segregation ATPase
MKRIINVVDMQDEIDVENRIKLEDEILELKIQMNGLYTQMEKGIRLIRELENELDNVNDELNNEIKKNRSLNKLFKGENKKSKCFEKRLDKKTTEYNELYEENLNLEKQNTMLRRVYDKLRDTTKK